MNMEINHYHGMKKDEPEGNDAIVGSDDSLPVDPFGMDIKFSRLTALFQDFDGDLVPSFAKIGVNGEEKTMVDDGFFVGVDLFFNGAWRLQPQEGNLSISDAVPTPDHSFSRFGADFGVSAGGFSSETNVHNWADCEKGKELGGEPHDALFFALGYLGVKDLLVAERLCRSLRDAVRGDTLLWRRIHIDQPLSEKITDEALVKLTSRAQGTLHCLSLVGCIRITDTGLMQVLESNPRLTKLCVPECVRLTIDGILCNLRILKSAGTLRIKHIRIGGLFGVTENRFEELKSLLGMDHMHSRAKTPQFHRVGQLYLSCDDDRAIDIEKCPKCKQLKLVYDCPAESCQGKDQVNQLCRACTLCIARCIQCGCCIKDCDYEETFCLDFLCLDCWKHLLIVKRSQK
ncbi:hypothetical protein SADUNF_Sadunf16G0215300 [Salix dunnii]|uniref:F-box domain-containing protein n=1 Tax=Salix dunnii TaxID=1413687 RepID=A0A835J9R4_9ROSI|nr:hypothetical protein SADUNF_Sadunf16G0215300 [Salix dunnii]